jgi:hypothetical protein
MSHHRTAHFRAGFTPNDDNDPNALFWELVAQHCAEQLKDVLGEQEKDLRLSPIWHVGRTWKDIAKDARLAVDFVLSGAEKSLFQKVTS